MLSTLGPQYDIVMSEDNSSESIIFAYLGLLSVLYEAAAFNAIYDIYVNSYILCIFDLHLLMEWTNQLLALKLVSKYF